MTTFEKARMFIYRNARPLDLARWQYHFEAGDKESILTALGAYQNEDGGFGHALEPDAWNPHSSPIQTWEATELLREMDYTNASHPIIQGILQYLASGRNFNGHFWYTVIGSNNDYPHAPWWHSQSDSACPNDYNPTACLAGFILRFADKNSEVYPLGCRIAQEAVTALLQTTNRVNDMHTLRCYIALLDDCTKAGVDHLFDVEMLKNSLLNAVNSTITCDAGLWEKTYVCKPSQFFNTNASIFYEGNRNIADFECEHIIKTQLDDGSWNIPWGWNAYPEEWAISKNWWKSSGVIENLLYLKNMGRL